MKKLKTGFPAKLTVLIVIALAGIILVRIFFLALRSSDYFKIRDVIVSATNPTDVSYLLGRNIFSVDLYKEASSIASRAPSYKRICLIRILPDRLFIDFIKRKPEALVKLYRSFLVDNDGVLFEIPKQEPTLDLPVIIGLDTKIFGVKTGIKYNINELNLALNIIRGIKRNRAFRDYRIKKIDVSSSVNTAFFIKDHIDQQGFEVKIGQGDIEDKVTILSSLLTQMNKDRFNIKYIDLRFKEPVIKLINSDKRS